MIIWRDLWPITNRHAERRVFAGMGGTMNINPSILGALLEAYVRLSICDDPINGGKKTYRIMEMNNRAADICKQCQGDVVGRDILDVFPMEKESWQRFQDSLQDPDRTAPIDLYLAEFDRRFLINPVWVSAKEIVIFFLEITDQEKAKDALRIHEVLFHYAQDIILYVDMEGRVLSANRKAYDAYGYSEEQFKHLTIHDIRDRSVSESFEFQMQAADTGGTLFESLHRRFDGSTFPVEVSANSTDTCMGRIRIHIIRDITKRREQEEKIAWLARYDGLTEILNRTSLIEELEREIYRSKRQQLKFAVLLFDVDKFKHINDNFSHAAGDFILKHLALTVKSALRQSDQIGRLGGDEFVVLQVGIRDSEDVVSFIERIREKLIKPVLYEDQEISFTISLGSSIFPDDATNVKDLLHFADQAMYETKRRGGKGYTMYRSSLIL